MRLALLAYLYSSGHCCHFSSHPILLSQIAPISSQLNWPHCCFNELGSIGPRLKLAEIVLNRANSMYKNDGAKLRPHYVKNTVVWFIYLRPYSGKWELPSKRCKVSEQVVSKIIDPFLTWLFFWQKRFLLIFSVFCFQRLNPNKDILAQKA